MQRTYLILACLLLGLVPFQAWGAEVTGRVLTQNGVGIPSIDIDVINVTTGQNLALVDDDTDGDGSFDFEVPDGRYHIRFEAPANLPLVSREFRNLNLTAVRQWDVPLEIGLQITGTVKDATGNPLTNADVDIFDVTTGQSVFSPTDETDGTGRFSILVPAEHSYVVKLEPPPGAPFLAVSTTTGVISGNTELGDFNLPSGRRVRGTVLYQNQIVPGIDLDAFDDAGALIPLGEDDTDGSGQFEIYLPDGEFSLWLRPRTNTKLAATRIGPFGGSGDLDLGSFSLESAVLVTGTIRDDLGEAVPGVDLTLGQGPVEVAHVSERSNLDGDYVLAVRHGVYDLSFLPPPNTSLAPISLNAIDLSNDLVLDVVLSEMTPVAFNDLHAVRQGSSLRLSWTIEQGSPYVSIQFLSSSDGVWPQAIHGGTISLVGNSPWSQEESGASTFRWSTSLPPYHEWVHAVLKLRDGSKEELDPIYLPPQPSPLRLLLSSQPVTPSTLAFLSSNGLSDPDLPTLKVFSVSGTLTAAFSAEDATRIQGGWTWNLQRLDHLPVGVYFARASAGSRSAVQKFVLVKP